MEKSLSIVNIAKALQTFHVKVGKVKKDATNPFYGNKYADLPAILDAIEVPLLESNLSFSQHPTGDNSLCTILIHTETGEYMQSEYNMKPTKSDPQSLGSAITYARRYALGAILGLNIDVDDDGNAGSSERTATKITQQATKQREGGDQKTNEDKPWLNQDSQVYQQVVTRIKNKTATMESISQHFKLSKQVRASLQTIINSVAYTDN